MPEWALAWLDTGDAAPSGPRASKSGGAAAVVPEGLTEEQEVFVEHEMADMRGWLQDLHPMILPHFGVRVLGGKWTMAHRHVGWDAIQGFVRTKPGKEFVGRFGLQLGMRFGRANHGRVEASMLAQAWASRMSQCYWCCEDLDKDDAAFLAEA